VRRLRRPIACLLLLWHLPACSTSTVFNPLVPDRSAREWQPIDKERLEEVLRQNRASAVLVLLSNGDEIVVRGPVLKDGMLAGLQPRLDGPRSVAFPFEEVETVAIRPRRNTSRWVIPVVALAGVLVLAALVSVASCERDGLLSCE